MVLYKMHVCCFDRLNIDPNNVYSDSRVWESLQKVNLSERIKMLPRELNTLVDRNGVKLSAGDRQLLSLARAWLRDVKVTLTDITFLLYVISVCLFLNHI
jgi:ABC-type multidrug transport system fused ATPase/permease subunit